MTGLVLIVRLISIAFPPARQIGDVVEGTVLSVKPYGAFVDIGNGTSGLLHISQISHDRITAVEKVCVWVGGGWGLGVVGCCTSAKSCMTASLLWRRWEGCGCVSCLVGFPHVTQISHNSIKAVVLTPSPQSQ